jgi:hypothetical protein
MYIGVTMIQRAGYRGQTLLYAPQSVAIVAACVRDSYASNGKRLTKPCSFERTISVSSLIVAGEREPENRGLFEPFVMFFGLTNSPAGKREKEIR